MFNRILKALGRDGASEADGEDTVSASRLAQWASGLGLQVADKSDGRNFLLSGSIHGKPWRLERGKPSRDFINGEELRARAELGVNEDVAVLIMNRPLKESLEKRAFALYTDSLQTTVDPNLPEELRWLSMYEEVGWDSLPMPFWKRYSVFADNKESAQAWVGPELARLMLAWPQPGPADDVPFIMMMLRGKAYLRAQLTPGDEATLTHHVKVYTNACEHALARLRV